MGQHSQTEADYFGLASAWDEELYGSMKKSRTLAWVVAGVSLGLAAMSIAAVFALTPLKQTKPYVIMVDKTTGYSEAVRELVRNQANPVTENETILYSELNKYLRARETFDPNDFDYRRNVIRLSTKQEEFREYRAEQAKLIGELNRASRRQITEINSIVPDMVERSARVRFTTELTNLNQVSTQRWVATIFWDYRELDIPIKDRFLNPLGFFVLSYRVDPESL